MKKIKALIVDDERFARIELITLLKEFPIIDIIGEADNINTALELINSQKPDLLFLDIQLAGETGFELLEKVPKTFEIVFVTAFDEYAIKAFEENALDYLLKPVNPKRLKLTIDRLLVSKPKEELNKKFEYNDSIFFSMKDSSKFIKISSISHIKSEGDYTRIILKDRSKVLVLKSLKKWVDQLPDKNFVRIHRSHIANIDYIERVEKWFNNTFRVYIKETEEPLEMSRRYAVKLKLMFNSLN